MASCRSASMQRHHELQGPRPAPLMVTSTKQDSHTHTEMRKKKKRPHQPVIIYVESPKVVHVHPREFRSVVQRLTGATAPSSGGGAAPPPQFPFQLHGLASNNNQTVDKYLPGGGGDSRSLSSFFTTTDQMISPAAFLFQDQNLTGSSTGTTPLVLPSLGGAM